MMIIEDITMLSERIRNILEDFTDDELIEVWNRYCEKNYYEEMIYYISDVEINNLFSDKTPDELIRMGFENDIDLDSKYLYFNLEEPYTTDDIYDVIDMGDLIDYIIEYDDDCGDLDIRELLDERE